MGSKTWVPPIMLDVTDAEVSVEKVRKHFNSTQTAIDLEVVDDLLTRGIEALESARREVRRWNREKAA